MRLTLKVAFVSLLAGCGPEPTGLEAPVSSQSGEPVETVVVIIESQRSWLTAPDFRERFDRMIERAEAYWDIGRLHPITFFLRDGTACPQQNGGAGIGGGCAWQSRLDPEEWVVEIDLRFYPECVEALPIVHEVGHTIIWDPQHQVDPRWTGLIGQPVCEP